MTDAFASLQSENLDADDLEGAGKRARRRESLFLAAWLCVEDRKPIEVRIRNLSEGGLMAEGAPPLAIGTPVVIENRNLGRVPGKIAWFVEGRAGVAFDAAIDPKKARKPVTVRP